MVQIMWTDYVTMLKKLIGKVDTYMKGWGTWKELRTTKKDKLEMRSTVIRDSSILNKSIQQTTKCRSQTFKLMKNLKKYNEKFIMLSF
jgi:hypothetical protein